MARPPALPELILPHGNVRQSLRERIDLAKQIIPRPIRSDEELATAEEIEKKWRAYNQALLLRLFTTDQFADEYASAKVPVHQVADRYTDPSLNVLGLRLIESVKRQVANLESIIERVELLYEAGATVAKVDQSHDMTKVFVVHGHDDGAREAVARLLAQFGIKPIILHEQASRSRTVIEKVEANSGVGFAVVLLTPDPSVPMMMRQSTERSLGSVVHRRMSRGHAESSRGDASCDGCRHRRRPEADCRAGTHRSQS